MSDQNNLSANHGIHAADGEADNVEGEAASHSPNSVLIDHDEEQITLNSSVKFADSLFSSLLSIESWQSLRDEIFLPLRNELVLQPTFQVENLFQPNTREFIRNNVLYSLVGSEIRRLWNVDHNFYPEYLREPYISKKELSELSEELTESIHRFISKALANANSSLKQSFDEDMQHIYKESIEYALKPYSPDNYSISDIAERGNELSTSYFEVMKRYRNFQQIKCTTGTNQIIQSGSDASTNEANIEDVLALCKHLEGLLLSHELRRRLWHYRLFQRDVPDDMLSDTLNCQEEFLRFAKMRGLNVLDLETSGIYDYVNSSIALKWDHSFQTTVGTDDLEGRSFKYACVRNASMLATAAYTLSGMVTDRDIAVSVLVTRVFPLELPHSELILAIHKRIANHYLPSLILHKSYSVLTVSQEVFSRMKTIDQDYYEFLENKAIINPSSISHNRSHHSIQTFSVPMSRCYALCRGLLEAGFVGYLPEFALLHCWDCLLTSAGSDERDSSSAAVAQARIVIRANIAKVAVTILQLVKSAIVNCEGDISDKLPAMCSELKTKDCINAINGIFGFQPI